MPPSNAKAVGDEAAHSATAVDSLAAKSGKVRVRIGDYWYDLTAWQHQHPGGSQIIREMNGRDATDAFAAIHSDEAHARLTKLGRTPIEPCDNDAVPGEVQAFRQFRAQLVKDGFWVRQPLQEVWLLSMVWGLYLFGTYLAVYTSQKLLAVGVLGLAMQQAGWLGHDFQHGRGGYCWYVGHLTACLINAFSPTWWSQKHNTHHVFPNFMGVDEDIANDPIFHLWIPKAKKDVFIRKYQHLYFLPVCAAIYVSWRIQSWKFAWAAKNYFELTMISLGYVWLLAVLPWGVAFASILLGGWLVGIIVTATHQSETMTTKDENPAYNFVRHQFDSTRNADTTSNPFMHYLWGGMQFQLEHHLFPTLPRYRHSELAPRVKAFAKANGLDYRAESVWAIWSRTLSTMHHYGNTPAL